MKRFLSLVPFILLLLVIAPSGGAQSSNSYDLSWNVIASGGTTFSSGYNYTLGATLGQATAGPLSDGSYILGGGFWGGVIANHGIYLPIVLRN
jgi:hypothetical protein